MKKITLTVMLIATVFTVVAQDKIYSYKGEGYELITMTDKANSVDSKLLLGATAEQIQTYMPDGTAPGSISYFLLRMNGQNILFDTGLGEKIEENLRLAGVQPEQIDAVILTHMHGDHIGGLLRNGKAYFPKAKLYITEKELEYWMEKGDVKPKDNQQQIDALEQYGKKIIAIDPDDDTYFEGIIPVAAYGHTPGHCAYLVGPESDPTLIWGDLMHAAAIQMPHPDIAIKYDVAPATAILSRVRIMKEVVEKGYRIAGMHLPFPCSGQILPDGAGYRFALAE